MRAPPREGVVQICGAWYGRLATVLDTPWWRVISDETFHAHRDIRRRTSLLRLGGDHGSGSLFVRTFSASHLSLAGDLMVVTQARDSDREVKFYTADLAAAVGEASLHAAQVRRSAPDDPAWDKLCVMVSVDVITPRWILSLIVGPEHATKSWHMEAQNKVPADLTARRLATASA